MVYAYCSICWNHIDPYGKTDLCHKCMRMKLLKRKKMVYKVPDAVAARAKKLHHKLGYD